MRARSFFFFSVCLEAPRIFIIVCDNSVNYFGASGFEPMTLSVRFFFKLIASHFRFFRKKCFLLSFFHFFSPRIKTLLNVQQKFLEYFGIFERSQKFALRHHSSLAGVSIVIIWCMFFSIVKKFI